MDLETQLFEHFVPGSLDLHFGSTFLPEYCKQAARLSHDEWDRYALDADLRLNGTNFGQRFKQKYFDTTYNFCLTHQRELIATLGFEPDGRALNIWQIQGVKGQGASLRPIKWERALVQYAVGWARANGAAEVWIPSVDHVEWAAAQGHLDPVRGRLRYDVTAKRCGFRRTDDGYYLLQLERQ